MTRLLLAGTLAVMLWVSAAPVEAADGRQCTVQSFTDSEGFTSVWSACWHISGNWSGSNSGTYSSWMSAVVNYYAPDGTWLYREYLEDRWHQTWVKDREFLVKRKSIQAFYWDGAWRYVIHTMGLYREGNQVLLMVWDGFHQVN
jgi:hypothetical protein